MIARQRALNSPAEMARLKLTGNEAPESTAGRSPTWSGGERFFFMTIACDHDTTARQALLHPSSLATLPLAPYFPSALHRGPGPTGCTDGAALSTLRSRIRMELQLFRSSSSISSSSGSAMVSSA